MAISISPGNIDDLIAASKEGTSINIFKKDFNGQIIKSIKLVDSMIAQSTFNKASLYASFFTHCTFVNCDFSEASLYGVTFNECSFNECNFTKAKFEKVSFSEKTTLNNCNFNGIDLSEPDSVTGLSDKDVNIIHETGENSVPENFAKLGFESDNQGGFILKIDDMTYVSLYLDPDIQKYRATLFINDESFLTSDLEASLDKMDKEYLKKEIQNLLKSSVDKLNEKIKLLNNVIGTIGSK